MLRGDRHIWTVGLVSALVAASIVFTLWPGIDLWASGLFYRPGQGFWLAETWAVTLLRESIRLLMYAMPVMALILLIAAPFNVRPWGVPPRVWAYIVALFLAGPMLLANSVLKNNWGRARPTSVEPFGGTSEFTPALRVVDQCQFNCSFVSGEGSGATALGIAMIVLAPFVLRHLPAGRRRRVLRLALIVPATGIVLRVVMGRHFLSDTVFAVLLVLAVAAVLYRLIVGRTPHPGG